MAKIECAFLRVWKSTLCRCNDSMNWKCKRIPSMITVHFWSNLYFLSLSLFVILVHFSFFCGKQMNEQPQKMAKAKMKCKPKRRAMCVWVSMCVCVPTKRWTNLKFVRTVTAFGVCRAWSTVDKIQARTFTHSPLSMQKTDTKLFAPSRISMLMQRIRCSEAVAEAPRNVATGASGSTSKKSETHFI